MLQIEWLVQETKSTKRVIIEAALQQYVARQFEKRGLPLR